MNFPILFGFWDPEPDLEIWIFWYHYRNEHTKNILLYCRAEISLVCSSFIGQIGPSTYCICNCIQTRKLYRKINVMTIKAWQNKFSKLSTDTNAANKQKPSLPVIQPRRGKTGISDTYDSSDESYFITASPRRLVRSSRIAEKHSNISPTNNSELQQGSHTNGRCNANGSNTVQPVTPDTAAETTGIVTSGVVQSQPVFRPTNQSQSWKVRTTVQIVFTMHKTE